MATQGGFGAILRNARLEQGYEIEDIAQMLTLRPDIVVAIEQEDFSRIPPKAYAKNMITSYAHLVGVDARRVTSIYADMHHALNLSKTRSQMHQFEEVNNRMTHRNQYSIRSQAPARNSYISEDTLRSSQAHRDIARRRSSESFGRDLYHCDDELATSTHAPSERPSRPSRTTDAQSLSSTGRLRVSYNEDPYERIDSRTRSRQRVRGNAYSEEQEMSEARGLRSRHNNSRSDAARVTRSRTNAFTKPKRSKFPIFIGIILLIIIAAIVVGFVSCKKQESEINTKNVAISGLNDPEQVSSGSTVDPSSKPTPIAPTAATFSYQIPEGQSVYFEIYLDDSETPYEAGTYDGPAHDSVDVTGKLLFQTTNPDGISVRVDGEEIALTQSEKTSWIYECTVDFNKILEEWKAKNLTNTTETTSE